jgi:hypothetical protein
MRQHVYLCTIHAIKLDINFVIPLYSGEMHRLNRN